MSPEKYSELQPIFSEIIEKLLNNGVISQKDAGKYTKNYNFFIEQKGVILQDGKAGKWAGSVNGKIFRAQRLDDLRKLMDQEPDANRGYIEQIKD
ncbi:hypothetical protein HYW46_00385 [Candidatus Daviesbacteria bacterium]|nr:hypothetical protein [Candidatus Daviesbacteria bacterium]